MEPVRLIDVVAVITALIGPCLGAYYAHVLQRHTSIIDTSTKLIKLAQIHAYKMTVMMRTFRYHVTRDDYKHPEHRVRDTNRFESRAIKLQAALITLKQLMTGKAREHIRTIERYSNAWRKIVPTDHTPTESDSERFYAQYDACQEALKELFTLVNQREKSGPAPLE